MTQPETDAAPRVHWNFFLGFVAAFVCLVAVVPVYLFVDPTIHALDGRGFGAAQLSYLVAVASYCGLIVTQVVFTVRIFRREACARVYIPGLVFTIANVALAVVSFPLLIVMSKYLYGG